jgi:surface polysaccharide O-acyltransferase-like enzyme
MIVHALPSNSGFGITMGAEWYGLQLLNCMCYVAVNVFILISGYFGIHIKFRSFIRF